MGEGGGEGGGAANASDGCLDWPAGVDTILSFTADQAEALQSCKPNALTRPWWWPHPACLESTSCAGCGRRWWQPWWCPPQPARAGGAGAQGSCEGRAHRGSRGRPGRAVLAWRLCFWVWCGGLPPDRHVGQVSPGNPPRVSCWEFLAPGCNSPRLCVQTAANHSPGCRRSQKRCRNRRLRRGRRLSWTRPDWLPGWPARCAWSLLPGRPAGKGGRGGGPGGCGQSS